MPLYDSIKEDFTKILDKLDGLRTKTTKLTFSDLLSILHEIVVDVVHATVDFKDAGPDHKQEVLNAAGTFFDEVLINIDIVQLPIIVKPIVDKFAREIFIELVGKAYDEAVLMLNKSVLTSSATTVAPVIK